MSYAHGLFVVGLLRFLWEGEEKYTPLHRLARVVALIVDYCSLFVICMKFLSRLPGKIIAHDIVVCALFLFFWFAAPLFGCLLKRKIAKAWCFLLLTLLLVVAAVCACRYIEPHPSGIFYRARR